MSKVTGYSLLLLLLTSLNGCWTWTLTTGRFSRVSYGYSVNTPKSWYQRNVKKVFQLTRDGSDLDCITMKTWDWGDTISTKQRRLSKDLLLHELPKLFHADLVGYDLNILSERVVMLDSTFCSETVFSFVRSDNVTEKAVLICCPRQKHFITIVYQGTGRYYFEKQKETFENLLQSVKFKGK